jgi:tetratricopeptide (TPR) repeat protein
MSQGHSEADKAKTLGNEAYQAKKYDEAISHYTNAIEVAEKKSETYLYYTNRALANYQLNKYQECLDDTTSSISINPNFSKAYYWQGEAYLALSKHQEANNSFRIWISSLDTEKNRDIISSTLLKLQKQWIHDDFAVICKNTPGIRVEYQDFLTGKSVFATKDFKFGEVIFVEEPLVSKRCIDDRKIKSCENCMRTFLSPQEAFPFEMKFIGDDYDWVSDPIICKHCNREHYCSRKCCDLGWNKFHGVLCQGKDGKAMDQLDSLCRSMGRTNPLLIAKMFALVAQETKKYTNDPFKFEKAFQLFGRFTQNPEPHEKDEEALGLIKSQITSVFKDPIFEKFMNINMYRSFNGLILRNASTVTPISDFHIYLEKKNLDNSDVSLMFKLLMPHIRGIITGVEDLLRCEYMNNLCVMGTAPFTIHNSMNHNCSPNTTGMSNKRDHTISVVAIKDIKKGDELSLSYIDETQDVIVRNKLLMDQYLFECNCERCQKDEMEKLKIRDDASKETDKVEITKEGDKMEGSGEK